MQELVTELMKVWPETCASRLGKHDVFQHHDATPIHKYEAVVKIVDGPRLIELTAREYALLEYLAMRVGQVVSRTDIWEHVYDFHSEAQSNVVDVYISHLRKKVDLPGGPSLIHTRRGHGYLLGELS